MGQGNWVLPLLHEATGSEGSFSFTIKKKNVLLNKLPQITKNIKHSFEDKNNH